MQPPSVEQNQVNIQRISVTGRNQFLVDLYNIILSENDTSQYNSVYLGLILLLCMQIVGHGGALVETITFNRRVVGSTPALAAT